MFRRRALGIDVVLYRTEAGKPVAIAGNCPHRSFPMEQGSLVGDAVKCGYHGLEFDADGKCTKIPTQDNIPNVICTDSYPMVETGEIVWIWLGDKELADESLIPDLKPHGVGNDEWEAELRPVSEGAYRYTLLTDNLADLTHVTFLHEKTIPGGEGVVQIPNNIIQTDRSINIERKGLGLPTNPLLKRWFPHYSGDVDQHFDTEYHPPGFIRTAGAVYEAGTDKLLGIQNYNHCITPIDEHNTRYMIVAARSFAKGNEELNDFSLQSFRKIQPEDVIAMTAVEDSLQSQERRGKVKEVSVTADRGPLLMRRMLKEQIEKEENK